MPDRPRHPCPGIYRHWKGSLYQVLFSVRDSTNGPTEHRTMVVYIGLALDGARPGLRPCVRELAEFVEPVPWPDGETRPRFAYVGDEWRREMSDAD